MEGQWARTDDKNDKPEDWLAASLIFANALSFLLKETEGVAIVPKNDMLKLVSPETKTLFVYRKNGQVHVTASEEVHEDGQLIWMHDENEKPN